MLVEKLTPRAMASNRCTDKLLKKASGAYDLELVDRLDLSAVTLAAKKLGRLDSLEGIEACVSLVELDVSGHAISDLRPLAALSKLTKLNVSGNDIHVVEGLEALPALEHLSLQGNKIRAVGDIECLADGCAELKHLYLQNAPGREKKGSSDGRDANPVCGHPSYTTTMLRVFPALLSLDGERLQLKQSAQAALLESMAVPKAAFEVPESKPWLEGFEWETKENQKTKNVSMLHEHFLEAATKEEARSFEEAMRGVQSLDDEAREILESMKTQ